MTTRIRIVCGIVVLWSICWGMVASTGATYVMPNEPGMLRFHSPTTNLLAGTSNVLTQVPVIALPPLPFTYLASFFVTRQMIAVLLGVSGSSVFIVRMT